MTLARITTGINKAEDAGLMHGQIGFVDVLRRVLTTMPASHSNVAAGSAKNSFRVLAAPQ